MTTLNDNLRPLLLYSTRRKLKWCLSLCHSSPAIALPRLDNTSLSSPFDPNLFLVYLLYSMPTILQRARAAIEGDRNVSNNTNTAGQPLYMPKQGECCVVTSMYRSMSATSTSPFHPHHRVQHRCHYTWPPSVGFVEPAL